MAAVQSQMDLTPEECSAIVLLARDLEDTAKGLKPGKGQQVSMMLKIEGMLNKGEPGTQTRASKPSVETVAGFLLGLLTKEARAKVLDQLAAKLKLSGGDLPEVPEDAKADATLLVKALSQSKTFPRSGSLTGSIRLSAVDASKLSPAVKQRIEEAGRLIDLDYGECDQQEGGG